MIFSIDEDERTILEALPRPLKNGVPFALARLRMTATHYLLLEKALRRLADTHPLDPALAEALANLLKHLESGNPYSTTER